MRLRERMSENSESKPVEKSIGGGGVFSCHVCQLYSKYDYYGTRPLDRHLLNKPTSELTSEQKNLLANNKKRENLILLEKCYVCDDPFSQLRSSNYLILGSLCSQCHQMVCVSGECSFFYYNKRFCMKCAKSLLQTDYHVEFPAELKAEIVKALSSNSKLE